MRRDYIDEQGLRPVQVKAGIVDADGGAKYTGLHVFRHFFASWCLTTRAVAPKIVQSWSGIRRSR
jgi:hypothetical protein